MTDIEFLPATAELVHAYYGAPPPVTVKAIVAVRDGKVLAIAGVHRIGLAYAVFSEMSEEFMANKRNIVRGLRELKKITDGLSMKIYAKAEDENNTILIDRIGGHLWQ